MTREQIIEDIIKSTADFQGIAASFVSAADTYARAMQESLDAMRELGELETAEIVEEPPVKMEAVRSVLAEKSKAGHTAEVKSLLAKYGGRKLSEVKPADYAQLLKDAEAIA